MKDTILILKECRPPSAGSPDQVIHRIVAAWLAKELCGSTGRLSLEGGAENSLRNLYTAE